MGRNVEGRWRPQGARNVDFREELCYLPTNQWIGIAYRTSYLILQTASEQNTKMFWNPILNFCDQISWLCDKQRFPLCYESIHHDLIQKKHNYIVFSRAPHACMGAEAERCQMQIELLPLESTACCHMLDGSNWMFSNMQVCGAPLLVWQNPTSSRVALSFKKKRISQKST